jgi:hypothetical protein
MDFDKSSELEVSVSRSSLGLTEACCRGANVTDSIAPSSRESFFSSIGRYLRGVDSDLYLLHQPVPFLFHSPLGLSTWSFDYLAAINSGLQS